LQHVFVYTEAYDDSVAVSTEMTEYIMYNERCRVIQKQQLANAREKVATILLLATLPNAVRYSRCFHLETQH